MKHSPAQILAALLIDEEFFEPPDGSAPFVFVGSLPDVDDNAVVLIDTAGRQSNRILENGKNIWQYGLQIKLRFSDYKAGWLYLHNVVEYLSSIHLRFVTIDSETYVIDGFSQTSPVFALGQDQKRRETFSANLLVSFA